jgi:carbon-monoxide dehydrogenase medium subunit
MEYHRPGSLTEACHLLQGLPPDAILLAGGTDVMVDLRRGTKAPSHLVSLADLRELQEIRLEGETLRIGALVTPARLEGSPEVRAMRPELLDAVGVFGTPQVRNRATVGGNLCTAASCADFAPLLLALSSRVLVAAPDGNLDVPADLFFGDHRKTILAAGHILAEILVPVRRSHEGAAYETFGLRATNFISVASAAAFLRFDGDTCTGARLSLGAVAPTPILVEAAEEGLAGSKAADDDLAAAAAEAVRASAPITDIRGSAEHRRELVEVLSLRALRRARERAGASASASAREEAS